MSVLRALAVACALSSALLLSACPTDLPCSDLGEDACLADEQCAAAYLESCGCSCADAGCAEGCCEFDVCVDPG